MLQLHNRAFHQRCYAAFAYETLTYFTRLTQLRRFGRRCLELCSKADKGGF
jgi:hypothetical protein